MRKVTPPIAHRADMMTWTAPPLAVAGAITHDHAGNPKEVTCPVLP